jgi:hypothetical protein
MDDIGGTFTIDSCSEGTAIRFSFPFTRLAERAGKQSLTTFFTLSRAKKKDRIAGM